MGVDGSLDHLTKVLNGLPTHGSAHHALPLCCLLGFSRVRTMFRSLRFAILVTLCTSFAGASSATDSHHVGIVRLSVADALGQADVVVWYPTTTSEVAWQAGPFTITATQGAPVAPGRFPLVLLSHGRGGGPFSHRELAAHLAKEGFIVVAPTHLGDTAGKPLAASQSQILTSRPRQAMAALDAAVMDERFAPHLDAERIGMIGYSAGGYTGLVLAGAKPDFALATAYCRASGRQDIGSCGPVGDASGGALPELLAWTAPSEPRVKALVLLDPLATMFDAAGLADVKIPVLLYRPQDDAYMAAMANALALAANLPAPPQEVVVPGRHFVFIDPCPDKIATDAAMICRDGPGIDRAAIHLKLENDIASFLTTHL